MLTNKLQLKAHVSAMAIALTGLMMAPALAETVTLKSADGAVDISGEFLDLKDGHYFLRTAFGDMKIEARRVACSGAGCPVAEVAEVGKADLHITGSDTVALALMPLLLSGYAASLNADATITETNGPDDIFAELIGEGGFGDDIGSIRVSSTTSGSGFKTLLADGADMSMASRRIRPEEARALRDAGAGNMVSANQEHVVAVDMLVVITHPDNPINTVSIDQLRDIYSGRISNWDQLGGQNMPIKVINRQNGSGTRSVFESKIFGDRDPVSGTQMIAEDNNAVSDMVNRDISAIGYVGFAYQRGAKPLSLINECGIATEADAFSAKTEEYDLQRRLYIYNRAETSEFATDFITYSTSQGADNVVTKSGFIDLGIKRKPQTMTGPRAQMLLQTGVDEYAGRIMRDMLNEMVKYDRLSTTFRFRTGSSTLDERGRLDMKRLVDFLAKQPEGTRVSFVGFTDDVGAFDSNRALSVSRAEQVISELREFAGGDLPGIQLSAVGYGEIAPSGCNTSDSGRGINRRVEVWIENGAQS